MQDSFFPSSQEKGINCNRTLQHTFQLNGSSWIGLFLPGLSLHGYWKKCSLWAEISSSVIKGTDRAF